MYTFVCPHGVDAAVVGDVCWFFTPCIPCEGDPVTVAQFVADARSRAGRLAYVA